MDGVTSVSNARAATGGPLGESLRLDGNAAAGVLSELFVPDLTAARATCASCGEDRAVGAMLMYAQGMGTVVRCPTCDGVIMRVVRTPTRLWLDLTGATHVAVVPRQPS